MDNQQETQQAINVVQKGLGNTGEVQGDQAFTIDRTIHYQEQGTNKTLAADAKQDISIVPYYQRGQVTVNYIDQDRNNAVIDSADLAGRVGSAVNYDTQDTINQFESLGYQLVSNNYPHDATFLATSQTFTVIFKHATVPVLPDDPGAPRTLALYAAATEQAQDEAGLYYALVQHGQLLAKGLTKEQAWAKLAEVVSPDITGYRLVDTQQKVIDDLIADARAARNIDYTVYYTRDQQSTPASTPGNQQPPVMIPETTSAQEENEQPVVSPAVSGVHAAVQAVQFPVSESSASNSVRQAPAAQLPQTGAQTSRGSILGFGVALVTALLSLAGIKKRLN